MAVKYEDRVDEVLRRLERLTRRSPEASALKKFIESERTKGRAGQRKLTMSFATLKELTKWAEAFINQE